MRKYFAVTFFVVPNADSSEYSSMFNHFVSFVSGDLL